MLIAITVVGTATAATGGASAPDPDAASPEVIAPGQPGAVVPYPNSGKPGQATLSSDKRTALPPPDAPPEVVAAISAANRITDRPYRYGGGHRSFSDSAYDCSGTVSYALRGIKLTDGARVLARPFDSRDFARWGEAGPGNWITVFTNPSHAYMVIAGLRFDTSGRGESGPRWRREARSSRGYRLRHWNGL